MRALARYNWNTVSDETSTLSEPSPLEALSNSRSEIRLRWFELALVLAIAFGNSLFGSIDLLIYKNPELSNIGHYRWSTGVFHELACLALLGYILARRKLSFRDLGLRWSFWDIVVGLALVALGQLAYSIGYFAIHSLFGAFLPAALAHLSVRQLYSHLSLMVIPFTLINPFFEELIVRAYLMSEIKDLTGSWTLAILASSLFQAAYHLYYGWQTAIALAFQFFVFSIYYARTRKATPLVTAHAFLDIFAMIRLM